MPDLNETHAPALKSWQQAPAAAGGATHAPVPVHTLPSAPGVPNTAVHAKESAV